MRNRLSEYCEKCGEAIGVNHLQKVSGRLGSLKQQLIFYNGIVLVFVLVVVLFSGQSSLDMLSNYSAYSMRYNSLSGFYTEMNAADIMAQNHLYTKSAQDLSQYKKHMARVRTHLSYLQQTAQYEELRWRVTLLSNMVDTYEETLQVLRLHPVQSAESYGQTYDFLVSTAGNIAGTAPQYYNLLTDEMNCTTNEMQQRWRKDVVLTFIGIAGMLILAALFSSMYVYSITNPIQTIVKNIHKIKQGQYNLRQVQPVGKEIAVLCDAFSDMAQSVQLHIADVEEKATLEKRLLETENTNLKMSELLTQTELKALQGQMNPHFLFNTLSMISKMAYMENAPDTSAMMETVADLLRYSLDKSSKTSDLLGEIECVRNYYTIQNKRIGHRVTLSLCITAHLRNMQMPGMVLQPLIENAVLHGVSQMTQGAHIEVCVYQDAAFTYLSVQDNGKGMTDEQITSLLTDKTMDSDAGSMHIGLRNVLTRLRIFYGNDFTACIVSDIGEGTMVLLSLPFV